ncbi:hypothetical protein SB778_03685 [Paraburkholderia sp. SIMBA_050]
MSPGTANDPIFPDDWREGTVTRVEKDGKQYVVMPAAEYDSLVETAHLMGSQANIQELSEGLAWVDKAFGRESLIEGPEHASEEQGGIERAALLKAAILGSGRVYGPTYFNYPVLGVASPLAFPPYEALCAAKGEADWLEIMKAGIKAGLHDIEKQSAAAELIARTHLLETAEQIKRTPRHAAKLEHPKEGALRKTPKTRHG